MGRYAFIIPAEKRDEVAAWIREQDLQACYIQLEQATLPDYELEKIKQSLGKGIPEPCCRYIQGKVTYLFVPTSLGDVTKVHHNITGAEIDITPYDFW